MKGTSGLAQGLCDYQSSQSLAVWFRRRRAKILRGVLARCYATYGKVDVVDIGGRASYWNVIDTADFDLFKLNITLINSADEISAGAIDNERSRYIKACEGDGCLTDFSDNVFELVHSNSVIEHVGDWQQMLNLASECKRLAPNYYMQTPSFWFPLEPHFMMLFYHWLPEPIRVKLLLKMSLGHMRQQQNVSDAVKVVQSAHLIDEAMLQALFADGQIVKEKIGFITKSLIAIKAPN